MILTNMTMIGNNVLSILLMKNFYVLDLGIKYYWNSKLNLYQMVKFTLELQVNVGNKIESTILSSLFYFMFL